MQRNQDRKPLFSDPDDEKGAQKGHMGWANHAHLSREKIKFSAKNNQDQDAPRVKKVHTRWVITYMSIGYQSGRKGSNTNHR